MTMSFHEIEIRSIGREASIDEYMFQHRSEADDQVPQPIRNGAGATDPGPRNVLLDWKNPDMLRPPSSDSGPIPNLMFSFSTAHNRLEAGGWAHEVTVRELPISTTIAGVKMSGKCEQSVTKKKEGEQSHDSTRTIQPKHWLHRHGPYG